MQTAVLIVFDPFTSPAAVKHFLENIRSRAATPTSDVVIESVQTKEFDPEIGNVVIYQP